MTPETYWRNPLTVLVVRLMWPECNDGKLSRIIEQDVFHSQGGIDSTEDDEEEWSNFGDDVPKQRTRLQASRCVMHQRMQYPTKVVELHEKSKPIRAGQFLENDTSKLVYFGFLKPSAEAE